MLEKVKILIENTKEINFLSSASAGANSNFSLTSESSVTEVLSGSISQISKSIDQLEETLVLLLSSSTDVALIQMIFVAVVGAFSAYLFNLFHWRVIEKKKKISRIGVELRSVINELESISVEYWTSDYSEDKKFDTHAMEISIKSKVRLIPRYIKVIVSELKLKESDKNMQKLENFSMDIFDLATGDEFESKDRKSSKPKALKILNECSDIRATILYLDLCG